MSVTAEEHTKPMLSLGRKAIGTKGKDNADGNQVLNDSLMLIIGGWVVIFLIWYSLRNSNI
jgi:hypothetical protein